MIVLTTALYRSSQWLPDLQVSLTVAREERREVEIDSEKIGALDPDFGSTGNYQSLLEHCKKTFTCGGIHVFMRL